MLINKLLLVLTCRHLDAFKLTRPAQAPRRDEDGFEVVKRRHPRAVQNRCGKVPLEPNLLVRAAKPNTPVYISRLHYTTKAESIAEYVCQKLRYCPRVQELESRRNVNFKSFVVRVPNCYLQDVLREVFSLRMWCSIASADKCHWNGRKRDTRKFTNIILQ